MNDKELVKYSNKVKQTAKRIAKKQKWSNEKFKRTLILLGCCLCFAAILDVTKKALAESKKKPKKKRRKK